MTVPGRPSRREVLVAGLLLPVLPLAACTRPSPPAPSASGRPGRPESPADPGAALRDAAVARERRLLGLYDDALRGRTDHRDVLEGLRAEHADHVVALGLPAPPPPPGAEARATRAAQIAGLDRAERRAAAQHARDALTAPRALAGLLAQLAAAEASHRVALP